MSTKTTNGLAMQQHCCQKPWWDLLGRLRDGWRMICRLNGPLRSCRAGRWKEGFETCWCRSVEDRPTCATEGLHMRHGTTSA